VRGKANADEDANDVRNKTLKARHVGFEKNRPDNMKREISPTCREKCNWFQDATCGKMNMRNETGGSDYRQKEKRRLPSPSSGNKDIAPRALSSFALL